MWGTIMLAIRGAGIGSRLAAGASWAARNPWPALCLVLLIGNGAQAMVHRHDRAVIAADATTIARVAAAQAEAARVAQAAHDTQQAAFVAKAKEADNAHQSLATRSGAALDRYMADHVDLGCGVQPTPAGGAGRPPAAPATSDSAAIPSPLPGAAILVSPSDVRACNAWIDYGFSAHDWAGTLNPP